MHPYLTERMLQQSPSLAPLGAIAVQLRERLDGSGYPRGLSGGAISRPARILGAADAYQSMCEPRPHRAALVRGQTPPGSCGPRSKRGAWTRTPSRPCWPRPATRTAAAGSGPAGLTAREVDVLRLARAGPVQQADRRPARDLAEDGAQPHRAHLREDRRRPAGRPRACSRCSTACSRSRSTGRPEIAEDGAICPMRAVDPALVSVAAIDSRSTTGGGHEPHAAGSSRDLRPADRQDRDGRVWPRTARRCWRGAAGDVLEIGGGTGANLALLRTGRRVAHRSPSRSPRCSSGSSGGPRHVAPPPTVLRAPAEDLPFDDDDVRHRRVHARALRRGRPAPCAARAPPRAATRRPAALHRARPRRRAERSRRAGPDELAQPVRRRLRLQPPDARHARAAGFTDRPRSSASELPRRPAVRAPAGDRDRDRTGPARTCAATAVCTGPPTALSD